MSRLTSVFHKHARSRTLCSLVASLLRNPLQLTRVYCVFLYRDECTHLGNFSRPVDPELAFVVTASHDGYVPLIGSIPVTELWRGCTHRNIPDHGHVSAILFKADVFRKAIADSFDFNCRRYHNCSLFDTVDTSSQQEKVQ